MNIAIHKNDKIFKHSGLWTDEWIEYCKSNGLSFEVVDCYENGIIERLKKFDILLWHFGNYVLQDMLFSRSILISAQNCGIKVFPDFNTSWHFDDKIAETYLLMSASAPIPETWMFYLKEDCNTWIENEAAFPLIAKLRCGSGSNNVKLLKNKGEAGKYAKKIFGGGLKASPSIVFKTKSQMLSAKNWDVFIKRLKRIPEFLHTLSRAKMFPKEKGYAFFQEYIPNDGYDLKIVVIGDKLGFIGRNIRKGDFRASGGGDLFFDKSLVTKDIIDSAFKVNDQLNFQCMGYDYVVDKTSGKGKIVEISYGFSHTALLLCGGYFNRNGTWFDEPLNAPAEILKNLLAKASIT